MFYSLFHHFTKMDNFNPYGDMLNVFLNDKLREATDGMNVNPVDMDAIRTPLYIKLYTYIQEMERFEMDRDDEEVQLRLESYKARLIEDLNKEIEEYMEARKEFLQWLHLFDFLFYFLGKVETHLRLVQDYEWSLLFLYDTVMLFEMVRYRVSNKILNPLFYPHDGAHYLLLGLSEYLISPHYATVVIPPLEISPEDSIWRKINLPFRSRKINLDVDFREMLSLIEETLEGFALRRNAITKGPVDSFKMTNLFLEFVTTVLPFLYSATSCEDEDWRYCMNAYQIKCGDGDGKIVKCFHTKDRYELFCDRCRGRGKFMAKICPQNNGKPNEEKEKEKETDLEGKE